MQFLESSVIRLISICDCQYIFNSDIVFQSTSLGKLNYFRLNEQKRSAFNYRGRQEWFNEPTTNQGLNPPPPPPPIKISGSCHFFRYRIISFFKVCVI